MPEFEVMDQDGNIVKSEDFIGKGRKTIIYFYPKDNTSGCTAEACSFRDNYAALSAAGYNVVGVSKDSVKSHTGFRARYGLPFRLLSDTSTQMLQAFGAWGEKKMYGKTVYGTLRRTFIFSNVDIFHGMSKSYFPAVVKKQLVAKNEELFVSSRKLLLRQNGYGKKDTCHRKRWVHRFESGPTPFQGYGWRPHSRRRQS